MSERNWMRIEVNCFPQELKNTRKLAMNLLNCSETQSRPRAPGGCLR